MDRLTPPINTVEKSSETNKDKEKGTGASEEPKSFVRANVGHTTREATAQRLHESDADIETIYPGERQVALLGIGLCLVMFTVALDNTILATAIPKITSYFNSLNDVGWYGSSYLLATTALQPSFGRIYTYFNVKSTYISGILLFEVGSVLCAAAQSSKMLIIGRAIAGAGASALISGVMTIIGFSVPHVQRPIFIALVASMFGISAVVGPLLGGAFADRLSWRWCFWINLPFGACAILAVALFFKAPKRKSSGLTYTQKILEIDLIGAALLICATVCLLLGLQWGGVVYAWKNSKVWGLFLGFSILMVLFIIQQFRRGDRATIPPRIFMQRSIFYSCLYSLFISMGLYVHIYYLPFYFQAVKGKTAERSGVSTIPYLISNITSSLVASIGITLIGYYKPFMIVGAAVFTAGSGMIYTLAVDSSSKKWIGYQLLSGFGAGAGVQIPFIVVQVVLSAEDMPSGNAVAYFFNSLGGAVAISIAQNIFSYRLTSELTTTVPGLDPELIINAGTTYLRLVVTPAELPSVLQAYMIALRQVYVMPIVVGGIAMLSAFFVEHKNVKGKKFIPSAA